MQDNGELNYDPSTQPQIIPAGYTSGGTINASLITQEDYNNCIFKANKILTNQGNLWNAYIQNGLLSQYDVYYQFLITSEDNIDRLFDLKSNNDLLKLRYRRIFYK